MLWRAEVQCQAAQEGLGFPGEIYWRSSQGRSLLSQHGMARLALPGKVPGQDMAPSQDHHELPTSIPPGPTLLTHSQQAPKPQSQGRYALNIGQLKSKGFPLPAPRSISPAHRRGASNPHPSPPRISPAPSPAGFQQISITWPQALATQHCAAPPSPSHLRPNQEKEQHPGLISINKLCQQNTEHQHKAL